MRKTFELKSETLSLVGQILVAGVECGLHFTFCCTLFKSADFIRQEDSGPKIFEIGFWMDRKENTVFSRGW